MEDRVEGANSVALGGVGSATMSVEADRRLVEIAADVKLRRDVNVREQLSNIFYFVMYIDSLLLKLLENDSMFKYIITVCMNIFNMNMLF
mmetsp:Transcript_24867/g.28466  ORF Transcript_24867/g.28466 Transcript_24867/m.28466 type:complete len:90 (+) Transcript_24867:398-667(+)